MDADELIERLRDTPFHKAGNISPIDSGSLDALMYKAADMVEAMKRENWSMKRQLEEYARNQKPAQAQAVPDAMRRKLFASHEVLASTIGDTGPDTEGMTEDEIMEYEPVFWAAQQIAQLIGCAPWDHLTAAPTPAANAAQDVRNQTLEEAAKICDRFAERSMHPSECAGAIRALKTPAKREG